MISALVSVLLVALLGVPIVRAVDRAARGALLAAMSFLYGSGAVFLLMLTLSTLQVRWTAGVAGISALALFGVAAFIATRRSGPHSTGTYGRMHVIDLVTLVSVAGYALFMTLAAPWEWDFWAIWGLKAKVFFEAGGLDWRFLENPWNAFVHPDYPMLVPLNFDFAALVSGTWDDRWIGVMSAAWGVSLLLLLRALAARETTPLLASLLTLALAAPSLSRYVGMAEGALVAFGAAGVLFVRQALRDEDAASWRHGALMMGLAANCKNEGVALVAAVTLALVVVRGARGGVVSRIMRLWPAYVLIAPWIVVRAAHALPTDLAGGDAIARLIERLGHAGEILRLLAVRLYEPWAWAALLVGLLAVPAAAIVRERFVFIVTSIQLVFFIGAYFATPYDVQWHVFTSWPRLTTQLAVPISFVVLLMLAQSLRSADAAQVESPPHWG
jgi:hypothetical protein